HADVHFYPGLGRHHITARASLYYAGIDGDAALEVHKLYDLQNLAGKLHDGVLAFLKIHTSVRSLATNAQGEVAHTLARGLEMSLRPLRRLQHQHRLALAGNGFSDGTRTLAAHFLVGIKKDSDRTMVSFGL